MGRQGFLGEFEQMVLLAVLQLDDQAYGPNISEELEARAGRQVSRGALYSSLDRLQQKKFLRWRIEGIDYIYTHSFATQKQSVQILISAPRRLRVIVSLSN